MDVITLEPGRSKKEPLYYANTNFVLQAKSEGELKEAETSKTVCAVNCLDSSGSRREDAEKEETDVTDAQFGGKGVDGVVSEEVMA